MRKAIDMADELVEHQNQSEQEEPEQESAASESVATSEPQENAAPGPDESASPAMNWYIIHAYSGFENKVAESLRSRAQAFGFAHRVGQILIPTEEVVELRNGKKVTSKRLLYPGYVLVQMEMDDELWHAVKATPRPARDWPRSMRGMPRSASDVSLTNAACILTRSPASKAL